LKRYFLEEKALATSSRLIKSFFPTQLAQILDTDYAYIKLYSDQECLITFLSLLTPSAFLIRITFHNKIKLSFFNIYNLTMFKYFEPNKIFAITSRAPKYVLFLFIVVLTIGLTEALILSPEDYKQSDSVRIMYVHVPAAWISLGIFSSLALLSVGSFIFKNKNFALIAKSLAPSGFVFNIIALVTGSIWGKPTWGTWWAWDARITSMLILALFYGMYLLAWRIYEDKEQVIKVTSLIAILGVVNVPVIKFSVDWWNTLHQPASINILSTNTAIHPSMLVPLGIMTAAFALFSLLIFLYEI